MDIYEQAKEAEIKIVNNYVYKNNLCIRRLIPKKCIEEFLQNINVFKTNLIRLGNEGDGGYLVPDDLNGIEACFSPGVADNVDFEKALAERKIPSYLLDKSINELPENNKNFIFKKKYLGIKNNDSFVSINNWIKEYYPKDCTNEFILQMDIEGSEYKVLLDIEENLLKKFRILVIEFHQFYDFVTTLGHNLIQATFDKILQHFYIVHIHANNLMPMIPVHDYNIPNLLEFTFLRKDRLKNKEPILKLPNTLDKKNVLEKEDIILPDYWYK